MKFARFWNWLLPAERPSAPNKRLLLSMQTLEERAVPAIFAVGAGNGTTEAIVRVYDDTGALKATFKPFPMGNGTFFRVPISVAVGDVNNDGVDDVIVAAGFGGGPHVKVYDGASINTISDPNALANPNVLQSFYAFEPTFIGGVNVAAGDVNGDGFVDIVCGAGPSGGPKVVVYSGSDHSQLMNFYPFETTFAGGVNVAAGDVGGDQLTAEIVVGAGNTGGPKVAAYNYVANANPTLTAQRLTEFFAYDPNTTNGVNVGVAPVTNNRDFTNNLYGDIITGSGPGVAPEVKVFRLLDAVNDPNTGQPAWVYFQAGDLTPYASSFTGGVHVGGVFHGAGGLADFMTGPAGLGGPDLKIWNQVQIGDQVTYIPSQRLNFFPFVADYSGGISLSGSVGP
ncbi:MAG: FG-GAP repeat domain-containing protein [Gemmataceae bacterium]